MQKNGNVITVWLNEAENMKDIISDGNINLLNVFGKFYGQLQTV